MSKAVAPRWHGDSYQSRFFWIHAASLLDPGRPEVVEVTFEADGPKAFDDVVVRYEPGRPRASGPGRVTVDYSLMPLRRPAFRRSMPESALPRCRHRPKRSK